MAPPRARSWSSTWLAPLVAVTACGPSLHTFPYLAPAPGSDHGTSFAPLGDALVAAIARGHTNAEIAAAMHITLSTVKTHVTSLMLKLGVRNRVEVAIWAYDTGRVRAGSG